MSTFYDENELDDEVNLQSGVLGRLLKLLKPYKMTMILGILSIAVVSWLDAYFAILNKRIIDEGIIANDVSALIRLFYNYGFVVLGQMVAFFVMMFSVGVQGERLRYDLRKNLFNHLQKLSLSYFSKTPIGWIMSRVTSDTEKMGELLTWGIVDTLWAVTNIGFAILYMLQ